jgi:hypothetical protein
MVHAKQMHLKHWAIIAVDELDALVQRKSDAYHQELRWLTKLEEVR